MATIATVNVQNFVPLARTRFVTTVIPLPDNTISTTNTTYEMRAVNAKGAPVRVQYHPFGATYLSGSIQYYKYARIIFECDFLAGTDAVPYEKTVTIEDVAVAGTAFTIHPDVVAAFGDPLNGFEFILISPGGFHVPGAGSAPDPNRTPEGPFNIRFPISEAQIIDNWKDPTNCLVRRYRIRARGDSQFGAQWWGELTMEIGHQNRVVPFWFEWGNSLIDSDTNPIYPNSNPIVEMYCTFNSGPADYHTFVNVRGPQIFWNHSAQKILATSGFTVLNGFNDQESWHRLYDPDLPQIPRIERFVDGASMKYAGVMCFVRGTPSGAETNSMNAEATDRVYAICTNWGTSNKWGVLGVMPPLPNNTLVNSLATAKAQVKKLEEATYAIAMGQDNPPNPFVRNGNVNYGLNEAPGSGGTQSDFSYIPKSWPWAISGHARMRPQQFWAYQDAHRPAHFRDLAGEIMDPRNYRTNDPARWTDVFIWDGRPFVGNGGGITPFPSNATMLGKRGRIGYESWSELFWPDNQHMSFNNMMGYFLLSGDWGMWTYLDFVSKLILAQIQVPSLGGERYGSFDSFSVPRAFGRSVMALLNLWNITGDEDLKTRALAKFNENDIDKYIGHDRSPTPNVRTLGELDERDCRNAVPSVIGGGPEFITWQDGIFIVGLYYLYKVYPSNPTILAHLKMYARSFVLHSMVRINAGVNYGTYPPECGSFPFAVTNLAGWAVPKGFRKELEGKTFGEAGPAGDELRASQVEWNSDVELWCWAVPVIAWELFSDGSDPEVVAKCKLILDEIIPTGATGEEDRKGAYGVGNYPGTNLQEFVYVVADAIKNRETGVKELHTRNMVATGDLNVELPVIRYVTTTGLISRGGLEGTALRVISGGGGGSTVALLFGSVDEGGGLYTVRQGTGDISVTLSVLAPPAPLEFEVSFQGTGSLTVSINTPLVKELSFSPSGIGSLDGTILSYFRDVQDVYPTTGVLFTSQPITVTLGDSVINENESFKMFAGNTLALDVTILDQNGDPVDLTTVTAVKWVLQAPGSDSIIVTKTLSTGITLSSPTDGTFTIYLNPEDTASRSGEHYHECQVTFGSNKYTAFAGKATVQHTVIS